MADQAPAVEAPSAPAEGARVLPWWGQRRERSSGPAVARLFHALLSGVQLSAWLSLAVQLPVLIGPRGLLPAREFFAAARAAGLGVADAPSLLWLWHSEAALWAGVVAGVLLSLLALAGLLPRAAHALNALLYLSYAVAGDEFTAFQWDNMLVETSLLAAFLPRHRSAPLAHVALRALLFKLYFESGIAKWQSHLGDWVDGSAMSFYYETAPLPARLAHAAHHRPEAWHALESWGALVLELLVPLLIWGPRPARLFAFAAFTGFQLLNTATANYGFFTYLSMSLHVFLLSDRDVAALARYLPRGVELKVARHFELLSPRARAAGARLLLGLWLAASLNGAVLHFVRSPALRQALGPWHSLHASFRVANVYHLFGHITRERIEPQFETQSGPAFVEHHLHFKPGPVDRPAPYVAPHQPRVDFRLWFYGLSFRRGMPRYVDRLLDRLCHDPAAVQPLFTDPLPPRPQAVRVAFYRYRFSNPRARDSADVYWRRQRLGALSPRSCEHQPGATR